MEPFLALTVQDSVDQSISLGFCRQLCAVRHVFGCRYKVPLLSGWERVDRHGEDKTESCRGQRDIFMGIGPFSVPRRIKTDRLLSAGDQRESAPSCVGTGGHPSDPGVLSQSMGKVPVH